MSGAAKFLSKRGEIRDQVGKRGAMAAIGLHHDDVDALLVEEPNIGIAAINGPGSTTISGDYDAVHDFVDEFQMVYRDTFVRLLQVDTAWHSYHLDAGEDWFRSQMSDIDWSTPGLPFISTVTAKPECRFDTDYGWLNLRCPVNFRGGIETAISMGATTFLELGPAATLTGPTQSTALENGASVKALSSLSRKKPDFDCLAHSAASLFVQGHELDWSSITGSPSIHVDLPSNSWVPESFWRDSEESRELLFEPIKHPFLGKRNPGKSTSWLSEINLKAYAYLKDHRLHRDTIFPAAGYIDTIIAMSREYFGDDKSLEIEDAVIHEALFIDSDAEILFSTAFEPDRGRVKLYSHTRDSKDDWALRAEALVRVTDVKPPPARKFDSGRKGFQEIDVAYAYDADSESSFVNYGDAFQTIDQLWMSGSKTYARISLRAGAESTKGRHHAHPTALDGCLQLLEPRMTLKRVQAGRQPGDPVCLPVGVGKIRVYADFPDEIFVEADQIESTENTNPTAGLTVRDRDGHVVMTISQVMVSILPSAEARAEDEDFPAHFVRQELVELRETDELSRLSGNWLLLGAGQSYDRALAAAMNEAGVNVQQVVRSELGEDIRGALTDLAADAIESGELQGIVVTWPLALPHIAENDTTDKMYGPLDDCTQDMIALADLLDFARGGTAGLPEIVVLTSGGYPDTYGGGVNTRILSQMPMIALVRGMATEVPEYKIRVIDADDAHYSSPENLVVEILRPNEETELVLRGERRFAPRLIHCEADDFEPKLLTISKEDGETNFHATMRNPGVIDHLDLYELPREPHGPDQVRVRVSAVGLNFRDIMAVTGLLPEQAEPLPAWNNLGLEFGAVVEAVGEQVEEFRPGDRVMGMGKRCLQRFMTVEPAALTLIPDDLTLEQAATIPSAFATAHYALNHVGRMRKGDKVFIHVATGGVGTAAVQLAQAAGAEIFATAGTPTKRKRLKELGVQHVMDSRSLKFADDVMRITKGQGVDILLNSLPGNFIVKGLEIMAPYGRFLEIGKRDVYEDTSVGMKALRKNVSLSVLDLASMGEERPDLLAEVFEELSEMLDSPSLSPLPYTDFPISRIGDAIRFMSQAKHIGKVVVTLEEETYRVRSDVSRSVRLSDKGSYLITGGTGGFSLSIAEWLSKAGAGRLILASRSGKINPSDARFVERLRRRGTEISVEALDVSNTEAVHKLVQSNLDHALPLKGVVHGAAVIKDGFANQLTPDMITEVLSPKIRGAWNLHKAFVEAEIEPDFFIGFSSISQIAGSAGQCNYIVGNAFLDALSYYRQSMDRTGFTIDWGAVADAGFVARNSALASYLESVGLHGLHTADFPAAMELGIIREAPSFVYSRADWAQMGRSNQALGGSPRMLSALKADRSAKQEVRARLMQLHGGELVQAASDFIVDEIVSVLKIEKDSIQAERPMSELGLDSLSSFELKIRIETELDYTLPVSKFLQAPSIVELSQMLADEVEIIRESEQAASRQNTEESGASAHKSDNVGQRASNRQTGLFRAARAPMTSDLAKSAMEYTASRNLAADLTIADLRKAVGKLVRRHPITKLRLDDSGYLQLDGTGPQVVEGEDYSLLNIDDSELLRITFAAGPDHAVCVVRIHAALGDQVSCDQMADDLVAILNKQPMERSPSTRAVLAALEALGFDPETPQAQADRAFWWYTLSAGVSPVPISHRGRSLLPAGHGFDRGEAGIVESVINNPPTEAELLVSLASALRRITKSDGAVMIDRKRNLRRHHLPDHMVGPFDIEQPLRVPSNMADQIGLAALKRTLKHADNHQRFDSYSSASEFASSYSDWGVTPLQFVFEPYSDMTMNAPASTLHDLWVQVDLSSKVSPVRIIFDKDVLSEETVGGILDVMLTMLGHEATPDLRTPLEPVD